MGKYVRHETFKGKQLLVMDSPGSREEDGVAAWEELRLERLKESGPCLMLIDSRDVKLAPRSLSKAKEVAAAGKDRPGSRIAFVGLSALQRSTAQLVTKGLRVEAYYCNAIEEAREWLVKEGQKSG